jgi:RNA polymerase sigma factor (sigma-70 family)
MVRDSIIEAHYIKHRDRYVSMAARRIDGDRALGEDATHNAYVRAMDFYNCWNPEFRTFDVWFNSIFNNCVKDILLERRNSPSSSVDLEILEDFRSKVSNDTKRDMDKYIQLYSSNTKKEVLKLHFIGGLSPKEISMLTDSLSISNIWQIISRFRKDFKEWQK